MDTEFLSTFLNLGEKVDKDQIFTDKKFTEIENISRFLIRSLDRAGYKTMTKIQQEIYSRAIQRRNCLIRAVTGSGKTLAYLLPIYQDLLTMDYKVNRKDGIYCIIMCPTKELCQQVFEECTKLSTGCIWIVPGCFVGGETFNHEKARLRKGLNVLVGTPSRIAYHLEHSKNFSINNLRSMVIEECDLSMSLGQGNDIKNILGKVETKEFTDAQYVMKLFTTASFNKTVKDLLDQVIKNDYSLIGSFDIEKLESKKKDGEVLVPDQLRHNYVIVDEEDKYAFLLALVHSL